MRYLVGIYCILILPVISWGQRNTANSLEVKKIMQDMKISRNMSYKYTMTAEYPNGQKDHVDGIAYMGNDSKLMYNDNDAMVTIYNGTWYYNADHREKTIAVLNVNKHLNKSYKEALERDMFENNALSIYLDSVISKYGKVKKFTKKGDTVFLELQFPDNMYVKSVDMTFDEKQKLMVRYVTKTFQPWKGNEYGRNKGTLQVISCRDFKKVGDSPIRLDDYFKIRGNKVVLKKYNKYTLTSKL